MQKLSEYLPPNEVDCVVYHSPCCDGFGGAYVFWKYIKETYGIEDPTESDRVRFIPYIHGMSVADIREKLLPQVANRNVVYIDICPNESVFLDMLIEPNRAIVLDHHESALKITEKFPPDTVYKHCYINQTYSGCMLAHQYCYPTSDPPLFLRCIEDRDIWAWKLEDISRPFTDAFYQSVPYDFKAYETYEDEANVYSLVQEGKILAKYKDFRIMELVKKAMEGEIIIDGKTYAVYIINTAEYISDLGHVLAQTACERLQKPCDFAIMWHYDERIGKIKVSLRSDSDKSKELQTNVSTISRYFGGGGHPNASGFSIDQPGLFLNALNSIKKNDANANISFKGASKKKNEDSPNVNWTTVVSGVVSGVVLLSAGYFAHYLQSRL